MPVTTTHCTYERSVDSRVTGYDVVYEFARQRCTTRTARSPGSRIALDLRPAAASSYDDLARTRIAEVPTYPAYPSDAPDPVQAPYVDPPYPYPPYGSWYHGTPVPV